MDHAKRREIASKGGKMAHAKGTAHEWTSDEARQAGYKGATARRDRSKAAEEASVTASAAAAEETGRP